MGGPAYLTHVGAFLPGIPLLPTGGIRPADVPAVAASELPAGRKMVSLLIVRTADGAPSDELRWKIQESLPPGSIVRAASVTEAEARALLGLLESPGPIPGET